MVEGCGAVPTELGSGERCVRTSQCSAGLVCSAGVCTNDLSMFGGGVVPERPGMDSGAGIDGSVALDGELAELDASEPTDGGMFDAEMFDAANVDSGIDAATAPPRDSGPPDSGAPDSGRPDSGTVAEPDSGRMVEPDSGALPVDAASAPDDDAMT